jgi:hypothetical protein
MRHLKRRESVIKHLAPTQTTGSLGSVTVSWSGTPASLKGVVQPLSSSHARAEYGERADYMKLIILPNGTFAIGDGIWIDDESTALPPWLIVSVGEWLDLTSLTVEKNG